MGNMKFTRSKMDLKDTSAGRIDFDVGSEENLQRKGNTVDRIVELLLDPKSTGTFLA